MQCRTCISVILTHRVLAPQIQYCYCLLFPTFKAAAYDIHTCRIQIMFHTLLVCHYQVYRHSCPKSIPLVETIQIHSQHINAVKPLKPRDHIFSIQAKIFFSFNWILIHAVLVNLGIIHKHAEWKKQDVNKSCMYLRWVLSFFIQLHINLTCCSGLPDAKAFMTVNYHFLV